MRASQSDIPLDHHKTVALLDVDETLISGNFIIDTSHSLDYIKTLINNPDVLNISLLNALKRAGIYDVYFFTDMSLNAIGMRERLALRAVMQEYGFTVHGVITPADSAWHLSLEPMNSLLASDVSSLPKKIDNLGKKETSESKTEAQQMLGQINDDQTYVQLVTELRDREPSLPGCAFTSAEQFYDSQEQLRPLTEKSRSVKAFVDMQSVVENLSHVKGKMLEHFLAYNSRSQQPFTRCVVCDDREDVLLSIQEANKRSEHAIDTATILVNNLRRSKNPSSSQPAKSSKDFLEEMINIDIVTQLRDLVDTQSSLDESLKTELKDILASKNISQSQIDQLRTKIEGVDSSDDFMRQLEDIITKSRQIAEHNNLSSASPLCLGISRLALYGSATTGAGLMLASGIAMLALGFLMIAASKGVLSPIALLIMKKGILACASSVGLVSLGAWGFLGAGLGTGTVLVGASAYALRAA